MKDRILGWAWVRRVQWWWFSEEGMRITCSKCLGEAVGHPNNVKASAGKLARVNIGGRFEVPCPQGCGGKAYAHGGTYLVKGDVVKGKDGASIIQSTWKFLHDKRYSRKQCGSCGGDVIIRDNWVELCKTCVKTMTINTEPSK